MVEVGKQATMAMTTKPARSSEPPPRWAVLLRFATAGQVGRFMKFVSHDCISTCVKRAFRFSGGCENQILRLLDSGPGAVTGVVARMNRTKPDFVDCGNGDRE